MHLPTQAGTMFSICMRGHLAAALGFVACNQYGQLMLPANYLAGLDELVVVVMHCLPDLFGTVSIHRCQVSTKLIDAFFCHTLARSSFTYKPLYDNDILMLFSSW